MNVISSPIPITKLNFVVRPKDAKIFWNVCSIFELISPEIITLRSKYRSNIPNTSRTPASTAPKKSTTILLLCWNA